MSDINQERFWSKVDRRDTEECWPWIGSITNGYGYYRQGRSVQLRAHRVSFALAHGAIPSGMCVCHKCDNPRRVNPSHLFLGTVADNVADKIRKGRQPSGDTHHTRKLNSEQVRAIRADGRPHRSIAADYKVTASCISAIKTRRDWSQVA